MRKDTIPGSSLGLPFLARAFARVPEETPNVGTLDTNPVTYASKGEHPGQTGDVRLTSVLVATNIRCFPVPCEVAVDRPKQPGQPSSSAIYPT